MREDSTISFVRSHRANERPRHRRSTIGFFVLRTMMIVVAFAAVVIALISHIGMM